MTTAIASLTSRKRALRKSLSSILRALSQDDVSAQCDYRTKSHAAQRDSNDIHFCSLASAIVGRVLSAPWFNEATTISCYLSMPTGEVDTSAIVAGIVRSGTYLTPAQFPLHYCTRPFCLFSGFPVFRASHDMSPLNPTSLGKNLYVPKVDATLPGGMDMLRIYDDDDLRSLPSKLWGIKEPTFQYRDTSRIKGLSASSPWP
jgi:5-formyltetrahydrofolate cyclo-ligase